MCSCFEVNFSRLTGFGKPVAPTRRVGGAAGRQMPRRGQKISHFTSRFATRRILCAARRMSSPRSVARRGIFLAAEAARFAHASVKTSRAFATASAPSKRPGTTNLLHLNGVQSALPAANFVRSSCRSAASNKRSDRPFGRRLDAERASLFHLRCERASRIRPCTPFRTMARRFVNLDVARRVRSTPD